MSVSFGSPSWTRTNDIVINSHALYRLSYWGIFNFDTLVSQSIHTACASRSSARQEPRFARLLAEQPLRWPYRLSYWGIFNCFRLKSESQHLPIFPGRLHPSIFGTTQFNFCVRHGNRWNLSAIGTGLSMALSHCF